MSLLCLFLLLLSFSLPLSFSPISLRLWVFLLSFEHGEVLSLYCWSDQGPKTSACLHCSESICHQGVHCCTCVPLPSGAELETLKCVSAVFKSQSLALPNVIWVFFFNSPLVDQLTFSEGFKVGCHHLVSVAVTAGWCHWVHDRTWCSLLELLSCIFYRVWLIWRPILVLIFLDLIHWCMMFLCGYWKKMFLIIYLVCL